MHSRYFFILFTLICLQACSPVAPWQRGNLAKPEMAVDTQSQQRVLMQHVYSAREAGGLPNAIEGGGCGCY